MQAALPGQEPASETPRHWALAGLAQGGDRMVLDVDIIM